MYNPALRQRRIDKNLVLFALFDPTQLSMNIFEIYADCVFVLCVLQNSSKTVVLLLEPNELHRLLRDTEHLNEFQNIANQKTWIVGTVGMNEQLVHDWSIKLKSKLFIVQPHVAPNLDFNMYFLENLKVCSLSIHNSYKFHLGSKDALIVAAGNCFEKRNSAQSNLCSCFLSSREHWLQIPVMRLKNT